MTDDRQILELYREEGKEEYAYNLIVREYGERLYWHIRELVCSHEDANDLLQDTLIKAWKGLPSFREESRLYTWLYRIATKEALTFLKKKRVESFLLLGNYTSVLESRLKAEPAFNGDELQLAVRREILKLPDKQRAIFSLRYFQELKYEEISQIMNTSVGALKASYHLAYQKIKKALEEQF